MKKLVLISVAVLIPLAVVIFVFLFSLGRERSVKGHVYDCFNNKPIVGADVVVRQTGIRYLSELLPIFGRSKSFATRTDGNGYFDIRFTVGSSANLWFSKEGFFDHNMWKYAGDNDVKAYLVDNSAIKYSGTLPPWTVEMGDGYVSPLPKEVSGCKQNGYFSF